MRWGNALSQKLKVGTGVLLLHFNHCF